MESLRINTANRLLIAVALIILGFTCPSQAKDKIVITVNQFVSHVALDAAYNGLTAGLEERGVTPNKATIIFANAQGSISNSAQIAKHQASLEPDFMVAIATPSAQTTIKAKRNSSILAFLAVTDPQSANLTNRDDIIGVADNPPIQELIEKVLMVFPQGKTIGVIFNSGEINSVKTVENLEKILREKNINLKKISITNSSDIKSAFNKIVGEVDIIYIPQDNTVVSALAAMVSISKTSKIPLIANDPTLVDQGVMMALGTNYFKSGLQLSNMIADLIGGKKLTNNVQETNIKELKINRQVAEELGIIIPKNIGTEEEK